MSTKSKAGKEAWSDPDDAPVWSEEMFRKAAVYDGEKLVRPASGKLGPTGVVPLKRSERSPGRPPSANPKTQVTLRLDPDILERFRATGRGWQSRINDELRKVLGI
jgi:uncharacterized protein (DUF4415 family)